MLYRLVNWCSYSFYVINYVLSVKFVCFFVSILRNGGIKLR